MVNGISLSCIFYCLTFSALVALSVIDWRTFEIPLGINAFIAVMGVCVTALDFDNVVTHLIGAACVSLFLYLLYQLSGGRAIGGGDIKLMAAAGLLLGWQKILLSLFLGAIFGSIIHIARMKLSGQEHVLAFGPYLAAGITVAMLYGEPLIQWYLGYFH
jgi:leader peptidase (prepilin peptidase)/N-methyltransferase